MSKCECRGLYVVQTDNGPALCPWCKPELDARSASRAKLRPLPSEPQEGAPSTGVSEVDRTAPVGGVPSCDSELAAKDPYEGADDWWGDGTDTALRLLAAAKERDGLRKQVEELTLANGIHCETQHHQAEHIEELRKERDDLRAKLAEAEKLIANAHDVMVDQKKRVESAEARCLKLKETVETWATRAAAHQQAAQFAETRVRELETDNAARLHRQLTAAEDAEEYARMQAEGKVR